MTARGGYHYDVIANLLFYQPKPTMSRSISLLCVAIAVGGTFAHAQKTRVVVVPLSTGEGVGETATAKFQNLVFNQLKARGDVIDVHPSPVLARVPSSSPQRKVPSLETTAALDSGKKAFDDMRFEDALRSLRKGIDAMLADPATADGEVVSESLLKLAASAFRVGNEKEAKTTLAELARFSPDHPIPAGYPPVFIREFEKAKKKLQKQARGSLLVEGPPGSTVFLNGRDLGMQPVTQENLPPGPHYVKVEGPKGERFGQMVTIATGQVKLKASFSQTSSERVVVGGKPNVIDFALGSQVDAVTQGRLAAYLKASGCDFALIGYVYKTTDTQLTAGMALFSAQKGGFVALSPASFDTEVLTANTAAFKLVDEAVKRLVAFGPLASLPLSLATKATKAGTSMMVAHSDAPKATNPDELESAGPQPSRTGLVPKPKRAEESVVSVPVSAAAPATEVKPVPTWVWVVTGIGAAAAVGVGAGFGISYLTKPVTGTVTASW